MIRFRLDRGFPIPSPAVLGKIGREYVDEIARDLRPCTPSPTALTTRSWLTSEGRRLAVFFTKTYTLIVNPCLAELDPDLPNEIAEPDRHANALDLQPR